MIIYIYLLMLMAVGLVLASILTSDSNRGMRMKLPPTEADAHTKKKPVFLSLFPTRKLLEKMKWDASIKNKLGAAHLRMAPFEFFNLKLLFMLVLGVIAYFAVGKPSPWIFFAVALGYLLPDIWLSKKIKKRKDAIARILPETVDLLGLCVEAGLDFTNAAKWVIEKVTMNPMLEELTFVLEEIKWGKSRVQALKDMSKRLDIPEIGSFVQTLVQAERMGTPVSEAFLILSEDTRLMRFHRGERIAMQAPLKILIPLVFCILPVIGIVIGGPILIQFMSNKMF